MKKLFSWLLNRWVVSAIGLVLVGLLIWFIAPEIAISGSAPLASALARLIAIGVIFVLWGTFNLIATIRQRKANQAVVEGLMAQPEAMPEDPAAAASREEREKLGERFREALAMLKEAKLGGGGGRRLLYQLPWYVIIGPPGSGKTTALANSGLKFPLVDKFGKQAVRGVGGTRNCDWFFTDDAVLIDTAGRYTTQDSDAAVDRSAWQSFLDLLRKHRPHRPIDGILVAFSITDIVGRDAAERLSHANAVKRRIQEIYDGLKVRAPIYVVFTKCDLIAGFTDFFGHLTAEEREQVWGTTFPLKLSQDPNALLQAVPAELDLLLERLSSRVIRRLEEERELTRRGLLMSFPEQLNLLKAQLQEFLGEALQQTRFEQPLFVRGIYFTSATQQGSPIDRIIGAVASSFHLERQAMPAFSGRGVSYFLTGLLRNVVFPEAGLVTTTGFLNRYRPYLLWGAYGGAAALTALMVLALFGSYTGNTGLIADVDKDVDTIKSGRAAALTGRGNVGDILTTLDALRDLPAGYGHRDEGAPLMLTFGLYQGDKLGEAAQDTYRKGLQQLFVPVLMGRIEQQITENLNNPEFLYQALKSYLMFTTPEKRDPDFIKLWVTTDWNNRFPGAGNAPLRERFQGHLDALFDGDIEPTPQPNAPLVARAQDALLKLPLGSRIYAQLKQQQQAIKGKEWTLADHVAADLLRYFRRRSGAAMTSGVPQLYTVDGYRTVFIDKRSQLVDDVLKETWVLGPRYARLQGESERADLERRVEELYLSDYIKQWEDLLNDLDLIPPGNVEGQAALVRAVSQPDSPIKAVLQALVTQMQLSKALLAAESKTKDLKDKAAAQIGEFQKWRERIEGLVTGAKPGTAEAAAVDPTVRVDRAFEPIIALVRSEAGLPPRIDGVLQPFGELYEFLLQVQQGGTDPKGALDRLSQDYPRGKAIVTRLENTSKVQPEPVRRWLLGLLTTRFAIDPKRGEAVQRLNEVLKGSVTPACKQALAGRYPLARTSTSDVNVNDFARIFGPGGIIDAFAKKYIEPYADTSVQPWRWTEAASGGLGLSSGTLKTFESAAKIRQAFFPSGAPQPQLYFTIEPLNLDSRARQVQLEIGDQNVLYLHGPRRGARVQWPPAGGSGARIAFTPVDNPGQAIASTKPGSWGFFHLLDQAKIEGSAGMDSFRATFDVQGYQATFQIRAESVINPFNLPELQQFQCPESL